MSRPLKKHCRKSSIPLQGLPVDVLTLIVGFVGKPLTLACLALTCKVFLHAVLSLPAWHACSLRGGSMFQCTAVPISRALRILITGRCELCQKKSVHCFLPRPFGIHAHAACISKQSVNVYYLTRNQIARLEAADTPLSSTTDLSPASRNGWGRKAYLKTWHVFMHPSLSIEGVELLSIPEAVACGEAYRLQRAVLDSRAIQASSVEAQRVRDMIELKERRIRASVENRRRNLNSALLDEDLPSLDSYSELTLSLNRFVGEYLSPRVTEPYPLSEAVSRVKDMILSCRNLEQEAMFVEAQRERRRLRTLFN